MPTLTKENAMHHCRTCLKKLSPNDIVSSKSYSAAVNTVSCGEEAQEYKDIAINICTNVELQRLISKYLDEQLREEGVECVVELPKHLCLGCYNKLNSFEKFQKRALDSAHKLNAVLSCSNGVTKVEIDEVDEDQEMSLATNQDDIYKLLLKDTLMETESVMLNTSTAATLASVEMQDPDPFGAEVPPARFPKGKRKQDVPVDIQRKDNDDNDEDNDDTVDYKWQKESSLEDSDSESDSSAETAETTESKIHKKCNTKDRKAKRKANANNKSIADEEDDDGTEDEEEQQNTRTTRSLGRRKSVADQQKPEKKKRRTKKEMEEWRQSQADKLEMKMKRRNKGTKNSFKCAQCNHCFAHKITLDAHVRKVHEGSKRPFQCDRCDKSYTFIGGLYTHIKEIHEAEVRSYSCDFPGCERIYTSFIAMQKHKRLKHTDNNYQKKYVCEQCGATFNQSGNLKYHRRTKHPTEAEQAEKEKSKERFECLVCQKLFHSRYTLKYHTLQLHSNDMKYECNVCGRRMAKKFMLMQHMLVHSTDKMPCEHCGKQFIRKFELEAHIRAVHMKLKPFECQYCSECFASRKTLRHHEYIHTGEKPYVCDICGQAYRQQTCLKNHRKSHEKLSAEALLAANINRTLMNTFLGPQQAMTGEAVVTTVSGGVENANAGGAMGNVGMGVTSSAVVGAAIN